MTEESSRSVGAILGLVIGLGLMFLLGFGGMIPGALFGAGGAVAGGVTGEKVFAWMKRS
jgi:outer membrane lipoprotein SlyB